MKKDTKKIIKIVIVFAAIAIVVVCNYLQSGSCYKSIFWMALGMISANW